MRCLPTQSRLGNFTYYYGLRGQGLQKRHAQSFVAMLSRCTRESLEQAMSPCHRVVLAVVLQLCTGQGANK